MSDCQCHRCRACVGQASCSVPGVQRACARTCPESGASSGRGRATTTSSLSSTPSWKVRARSSASSSTAPSSRVGTRRRCSAWTCGCA
eukprot:10999093-Alexandrium_andersonii.AAC.1